MLTLIQVLLLIAFFLWSRALCYIFGIKLDIDNFSNPMLLHQARIIDDLNNRIYKIEVSFLSFVPSEFIACIIPLILSIMCVLFYIGNAVTNDTPNVLTFKEEQMLKKLVMQIKENIN